MALAQSLRGVGQRSRTVAFAAVLVLLAAAAIVLVQPDPPRAYGHGGLTFPATRTYACYRDGIDHGVGGNVEPVNPACVQALAENGNYPFYNWFGNLISDAGGRHQQIIPDGNLCGVMQMDNAAR